MKRFIQFINYGKCGEGGLRVLDYICTPAALISVDADSYDKKKIAEWMERAEVGQMSQSYPFGTVIRLKDTYLG